MIIRKSKVGEFVDYQITDIEISSPSKNELIAPLENEKAEGEEAEPPLKIQLLIPPPPPQPIRRLTLTMAEVKHIYTKEVEKQEEALEEKLGLFKRIMKYVTMPIEILEMMLIPNVEEEKLETWYSPLIPYTSSIGILTITKSKRHSLRMVDRFA